MAYKHVNSKGVTYHLNAKRLTWRGGYVQTVFFFSKDNRPATGVDLPTDRTVNENPRTGFLILTPKGTESPAAETAEEASGPTTDSERLGLGIFPDGAHLAMFPIDQGGLVTAPDGATYEVAPIFGAAIHAIDRCIDRLDRLIREGSSSEASFQECLEECPELLRIFGHAEAVPRVVLEAQGGRLVPDFILRPVVEDDLCDILELKVPTMPLLTGKESRPQFTTKLAAAVTQLHDYAEALDDPRVRRRVEEQYDLRLFQPRLYVIAGRSTSVDRTRLRRAMAGDFRTSIYTWDDVLTMARKSPRR
ncbi:MAG: DUF4263 domain-containing protein [Actinomycetota bacterium]|nr:DUF4263 domain-containing protein [Actinomycetota bacterium]MDQ2981304.1 DUF4263 domain-containing protein [Actinomycetota bacterium]